MKEFDQRNLPLLAAGLLLGIGADLLLRETPWGINILIWTIAFIAIAFYLERRHRFGLPPRLMWLAPSACFFAAAFAWRDSPSLALANGAALGCVMALAALRNRSGCLVFGRVMEFSFGLFRPWLYAPFSFLKATFASMALLRTVERPFAGTPLAVLRGVIIACPLLFVFGALFARADANFEGLVNTIIVFDMRGCVSLLLWLPVCVLVSGGILLRMLSVPETTAMDFKRGGCSLGLIETAIVLGLINLLFCAFIATQFTYFFNGSATLTTVTGLSMADYARRGFFELVTVSGLLLPLLLGLHWLSGNASERTPPLVAILSVTLVVMLFAVMASAMHRMYLYQESFGLTELRLYVSAAMVWLALVFACFLATVPTGKRGRFAFGALAAGLAVIAFLDLVNPDALIVGINTARRGRNRPVDMDYLVSLSADAVPALVEALPYVDKKAYGSIMAQLASRMNSMNTRDWRSWNRSRQTAAALVRSQSGAINQGK